ncbi:translation initiation factor IF-2 subunit alpha [Sulfolobus acidocaldarius]|uniref:Translation initiation factor eIF2 alpha n=4 Tax=Sulfolobus acidocaldarius TaxID=2285 RepID=Q4J9B3_SULAC|nr:translation initiation factor IF-2 subunit alpha [Sulfolobus acidocaldarius]AHC51553.1 translation initiation factor IF-2 subunit alpha [Sulfolobus acidocaldarius SUSAZ]AAY80617.1 translation initiation factor eIF2 alpha [Sulfolobus acidocaldarius DSM 639]AGE71209.1 translation initiation factor IF-2 subunit alpha [Sulfolobus acidocaldarius N8]AGE73479.1 translation initiation factor IF-2 subunit alpha [Sulfolobus acidocaldarius Ron12/I]ALU28532.1 translation initiation factor IF-2 subunit 
MIYNRNKFPSDGEVLVATVKQIFDYGSYVYLDEYSNLQAFLPWSEISSRWVKNIRDVLKEDRKIVVKVIRIDRKKGTVDVSLKKVTEDEKKKKMMLWKKTQRVDKILEIVSQKLGKKEDEAWRDIAFKLEEKYGNAFDSLLKAYKEGDKILKDAGVPDIWIKPLMEEIGKHIEEKKVKASDVISLRTIDPGGVEKIKKVIDTAVEKIDDLDVEVKIYTIGAPRYRIDVIGTDQKLVSNALQELINLIKEISQHENVTFSVVKK